MNKSPFSAIFKVSKLFILGVHIFILLIIQIMDSDLRSLIDRDLNVVVLGKSQNGKSTFLNAMVNYFMFTSLLNALSVNFRFITQLM